MKIIKSLIKCLSNKEKTTLYGYVVRDKLAKHPWLWHHKPYRIEKSGVWEAEDTDCLEGMLPCNSFLNTTWIDEPVRVKITIEKDG